MLEDTLVVFMTEFGRTAHSQGGYQDRVRVHHGRSFTIWRVPVKGPSTVPPTTSPTTADPVEVHCRSSWAWITSDWSCDTPASTRS